MLCTVFVHRTDAIYDFLLGYCDPQTDGGLEEDLAARRYRSLLPDDYDSEDDS